MAASGDMVPQRLLGRINEIDAALATDEDLKASLKDAKFTFALKSNASTEKVVFQIRDGQVRATADIHATPLFVLSARVEDWNRFFEAVPAAPFQSYWGILRTLGDKPGVEVIGDSAAFAKYARVWRLTLDRIRLILHGQASRARADPLFDDEAADTITGRYIRVETLLWGKGRIFCESAGTGPQQVLFLHTAGSDSRQYHSLMESPELQKRSTMHAFDLPGHGRSDLGTKQTIGKLTCDEDAYVGTIKQVIHRLSLKNVVVCGASMAGQVCLAVALRARELGVSGVIPCEACEHLPKYPAFYGFTDVDESILNPETVCGMMSPTAPEKYKKLVWWGYSSQGTGIFKGDLTFYFRGWDGRGRMGQIDTKTCPVYMLTGEYDYSCTPETSEKTAKQIPGAMFASMKDLGHFPLTENPEQFTSYFHKALDHIQNARE